MASRYTTVDLVRAALRAPTNTAAAQARSWASGGEFDALILQDIEAAEAVIDAHCGRRFDGYTGRAATRQFPVRSRDTVITDDYAVEPTAVEGSVTGVYAASDWRSLVYPTGDMPGFGIELIPGLGWFQTDEMLEVTAVWGWRDVPATVRKAASLLASRFFLRSESPVGMQLMEAGAAYISKTDPDVVNLLSSVNGRGVF